MWQACYLLDIEGLKATAVWEALLDQERLQKYQRIKNEAVALQSLGAGLLLQLAAGEFLDWRGELHNMEIPIHFLNAVSLQERLQSRDSLELTYRYNAYGKPYFTNVPLYFSLSHSGKQILCACSEQEIGADLQKVTGIDGKRIVGHYFSKAEKDHLSGIADEKLVKEAFFRLWTRKEAYGKLTGDGILKVVDVPLLKDPEPLSWKEGHYVLECGDAYYYSICERL